jgi:iron complex outermembrane receptor protein
MIAVKPDNRISILAFLFVMLAMIITPETSSAISSDLTELSIEELANIEVISVSRTPQKQSRSAAAIFVITAEDIRRAGVTSIPEALRMVPGLDVARLSSSKWAVSSRGFNSRYSNKLLVLLDGRSLYLPTFSGVFWENQDLFIEDVERIEVVRGPGASLWGANAVNGVINIITKNAGDTQGLEAVAGGGTYERGFARARFGDQMGDKGFIRGYASYFNRDEMVDHDQNGLGDSWEKFQTGFRSDSQVGENCNLTIQGDIYKCLINEESTIINLDNPPTYSESLDLENETTGYNLLSRYTHRFQGGSETALQVYYDSVDKEEGTIRLKDRIFDVDFQFRLSPLNRHELVWGLGYRVSKDEIESPLVGIAFDTPKREDSLYSSFIQDTISLSDNFQVIVGSRFEHNEYTGMEIQPNIRFLWEPTESHLLWSAVSRAVRTPSRGDNDIRFTRAAYPVPDPDGPGPMPDPTPVAVTIWGLSNYRSEDLMAYEIGHRLKALDTFSLDTTAFYYRYDNLSTYEQGDPYPVYDNDPAYILKPLYVGNRMEADTWGAELSANWQAFPFMRFIASYTFYDADIKIDDSPDIIGTVYNNNQSANHQASLRTSIDMPFNTECDIWLRYVDDILEGTVDSYTEMDVRMGWKASRNVELSVCGQNLLHKSHTEYVEDYVLNKPTEVPRSVYGKITLRY